MGDDGARAVELFAATGSSRFAAGAIELARGAQRRLLAPTFPAGELLLFIPWRWSPRNLARRSKQ